MACFLVPAAEAVVGLSAVTLGAIAWLAILLVKDPKRVFKQQ